MGNQQIQTVICGVPLLVSYFPAKPLPRLSVIITVIALRLGDGNQGHRGLISALGPRIMRVAAPSTEIWGRAQKKCAQHKKTVLGTK